MNMITNIGNSPSEMDCLSDIVYLERYVNEGTRNYSKTSTYNEFDEKYRHDSETSSFSLPSYIIPKEMVDVHLADPSPEVLRDFIFQDGVRFCVHPQFIDDNKLSYIDELKACQALNDFEAIPSSSTRSVFIVGKDYGTKLHCPLKISKFVRSLGPKTLEHCVTISKCAGEITHPSFAYQPESVAITLRTVGGKRGWGYIVREFIPRPLIDETRILIPCFSLYAKFKHYPNRKPLLTQLIRGDPVEFVLREVIYLIIACWIHAFVNHGLIFESHGQNVSLEYDGKVRRIVHKDFDLSVHLKVRRKLGLRCEGFHPTSCIDEPTEYKPWGSEISRVYDRSMGECFFDFLAECMREHYGIDPLLLQTKVSEYFEENFPQFREYFPEQMYVYSDKEITPNQWALTVADRPPKWRPFK